MNIPVVICIVGFPMNHTDNISCDYTVNGILFHDSYLNGNMVGFEPTTFRSESSTAQSSLIIYPVDIHVT